MVPTHSPRLFRAGELPRITSDIGAVLGQKNFPCLPALRSFHRGDYVVGVYGGFGRGRDWSDLRADLLWFLDDVKRSGSAYSTMWAIYPKTHEQDEDDFEDAMWNELSHLTSVETQASDWDGGPSDPRARDFSFRIGGEPLFVVGLHPRSSRLARRFPWTALVFNAFEQFEALEREGAYSRIVRTNRNRDRALQGSENPMVAAYAEVWESIQFSGRKNPPTWECPFRFMSNAEKR